MFKPIPGYDGKYKINESGIILNKKNHVMKPAQSSTGYNRVALEIYDENGKLITRNNRFVHRLVAETFIPNPNSLPVVMHLDNDKMNCHVSNLQWGTYKDNTQQALYDEIWRESVKRTQPVFELKKDDKIVECVGFKGLKFKTGYYKDSVSCFIDSNIELPYGDYSGYTVNTTDRFKDIIRPLHFNKTYIKN